MFPVQYDKVGKVYEKFKLISIFLLIIKPSASKILSQISLSVGASLEKNRNESVPIAYVAGLD